MKLQQIPLYELEIKRSPFEVKMLLSKVFGLSGQLKGKPKVQIQSHSLASDTALDPLLIPALLKSIEVLPLRKKIGRAHV